MCKKNIKLLCRTQNGIIRYCYYCKKYNVAFNNIYLELSKKELDNFKSYINMTDVNYWESEYGLMNNKSIPIPTAQNNLMLVFNRQEFYELKRLLNHDKNFEYKPLSYNDIEGKILSN